MTEHRGPLNVSVVGHDLVGPGRPWRRLDVVESTGSTNADLLARHAAGEDIAGAVLIAEYQSAGRGRHGRSWSAPARSQIALSAGVDAAGLAPAAWGWLPLLTGVAVRDAKPSMRVVETVGLRTGTDNHLHVFDVPVGQAQIDLSTVTSSARGTTPRNAQADAMAASGVDKYDIPAFLRRQSD
jgi:hypothetical protein